MAEMLANSTISVMKIKDFRGLNENPDGDTNIKQGELSVMRNFKITRDNHLQIRPGTKTILNLREAWEAWGDKDTSADFIPRFCGAWHGKAGDSEHTLAAYGGAVFDIDMDSLSVAVVGKCTQDTTFFFGFESKVYLLNGHEYLVWDGSAGTSFAEVDPYVPIVLTAATPLGAGTSLENINRLTNKRKVQFSPDGEAVDFYLPEADIGAVLEVTGTSETYTVDAAKGKISFEKAPAAGVNTVLVTYAKGESKAADVCGMHYAELFNGATDTRVFLYGDGSNRTLYSGVNYITGRPDASYFPDLYEASVGEANTPITAMIRHYSRLLVFKSNSAWSMQYEVAALATGGVSATFYVTPVNRQIGNAAPGQVHLLENNPLTLYGNSIYQWRATSSSGNITSDNRNASRVSDRVASTLSSFGLGRTKAFNRVGHNEYWFLCGGKALILNYASDAWYIYSNMPYTELLEIGSDLYGLSEDGRIAHFSRNYRNDDGADIDAYAATGSMDFDRDWLLKYSPMIFVALKPEANARVTVTVETNKRSDYPDKVVAANFSVFTHLNFAHFSFSTSRKPQVRRVKMKVKKATFYKLVFKSKSASATATVLGTDVQLRYAGTVK